MLMLALIRPFVLQVIAVPAMIPLSAAVPRFAMGGGGVVPVTVTVAVPEMAPLVALTVLANVPPALPAVKRPVLMLMVPPPFTTVHAGAIGTMLPLASRPTAANVWVALASTVTGFGVTVMVASAGAVAVSVTVAVPETLPLVALTVLANVPAVVPAVKRPLVELMVPPPFTAVQTGEIGTTLPFASLPTAVNCCVPLVCMATGFGDTVMEARPPLVTVTVAKPATEPMLARTVLV